MFESRWRRLLPIVALIAVAIVLYRGCPRGTKVSTIKSAQQQQDNRGVGKADAILKAAANQLSDLPAAIDTELRPPVVVLDSRKSGDNQDVYAVCVSNPKIPDGPINIIHVPANNGRFRSLLVQPGDILKFYVLQDQTVDPDSFASGLSVQKAMNLKIAQVVDENTLLLEASLNQPVVFPAKIEIWRNVDTRLKDINEKLTVYINNRFPALGWEPAPDDVVMMQIAAWLNQWVRQANPATKWKRDALIDSLPKTLLDDSNLKPLLTAPALAANSFAPHETRLIQEAIWLRDITRWAHGDALDEVGRASGLFDWTVRNIQLEPDAGAMPYRPWHALAFGRGTAEQRAWVFAGLCRQQALPVVMLAIPLAADAAGKSPGTYWLAALVSNKQLYLFDPRLGLPIAGPDGKGIATLEQVTKDDGLLRKMDLEGAPYPLTADVAKQATAYVVADPFELTKRANQLEGSLSGEEHAVFSVIPSEIADAVKAVPGIAAVGLWDVPFRTLRDQLTLGKEARETWALDFEPFAVRPTLWKARMRQFQGRQIAPPTPASEEINDHEEATRLYMSKNVRPPDRDINSSTLPGKQRVEAGAKLNATYWIGLMSFDDGKPAVAAQWFARPELAAKDSPWAAGARYNLGRALEAQQKFDEAIPLYEGDTSPQAHGNKLRARELKSRRKPEKPAAMAK
ncbi:MAG: hypothetical protein U0805_06115 [Pirellulales bacterium]